VYQCCNGFLLGADGFQQYSHRPGHQTANNTWGQAAYVSAGRAVVVNIDPATNVTVTAAAVCMAALERKESYVAQLVDIAGRERLSGFTLDWEDGTGNDVACFNTLWGYVAAQLKPHNLSISVSMDDSNHQGPMDNSSTAPWATEWDWIGYVAWAGTLVNMGTYPGAWSKGLSYPAATHLLAVPCPEYPQKMCGLEGQIENMVARGVDVKSGQLSPGLSPGPCSSDGSATINGWTQESLANFLLFLDSRGVRSVTLWFSNALQLYSDSFTCAWFVPTLLEWAKR